jgi:hypothetical protein
LTGKAILAQNISATRTFKQLSPSTIRVLDSINTHQTFETISRMHEPNAESHLRLANMNLSEALVRIQDDNDANGAWLVKVCAGGKHRTAYYACSDPQA